MYVKRVKNFFTTWFSTSYEIGKAFNQASKRADISRFKLFSSALRQSSSWAYYLLQREILDYFLRYSRNPKSLCNEVSDKVAILIPWYNLTDKSLEELKNSLIGQWVQVETIDIRMRTTKDILYIRRKVWEILNKTWDQQRVLFWYSSWGIIAHKIWQRKNIPSVSFWAPSNTSLTMITTLLELFWDPPKKDIDIPNGSINIIEEFSSMVPHTWDIPKNTEIVPWVHSHMSIHQLNVVERITQEIMQRFSVDTQI